MTECPFALLSCFISLLPLAKLRKKQEKKPYLRTDAPLPVRQNRGLKRHVDKSGDFVVNRKQLILTSPTDFD